MENKEREAFEAEFSKIKSDIAFWLHTWDEEMQGYNHPVMCWFWYMWQAKKHATPEGFVLVKKELSRKSILLGLKVLQETDDIEKVFGAMIEAQEQSHD